MDGLRSRQIPEEIKRTVRQRCAFGCVICGLPIFDYDHVKEFAQGGEHEADNLVLLCPNHHAEKSRGRLTAATLERFILEPHNKGLDRATGHHMHLAGTTCRLDVGGNSFEFDFDGPDSYFSAICIGGKHVLGARCEDGFLLLDAQFRDKSDKVILEIVKGELLISTGVWDFNIVGSRLTMRSNDGTALVVVFDESGFSIPSGLIRQGGIWIEISPNKYVVMPHNMTFSGNTMRNNKGGGLSIDF